MDRGTTRRTRRCTSGRVVLTGLLAVVLTVAAAPTPLATPAAPTAAGAGNPGDLPAPPRDDPFYQPPDPVPDVPPGTLLRTRPVTVRGLGLPLPVEAHQVLYRSTDTTGDPNAVSGTVLLPPGPTPSELVAYNVGSHGLGPGCAPSWRLRRGTEQETALIARALSRGWAVAVTDYEGSGTPGPHTYGAGPVTGRAVLDGVRAALRLPEAGLDPGTRVGLWGYSEGGLASAWAAQLAEGYAPELDLVGVAAGGVPADLASIAERIDGGGAFGLLLAAAVGLDRAHPGMDLGAVLNERGREAHRRIRSMCVEELVPAFAFHRMDEYTRVPDAVDLPRIRRVLAANRLGGRPPTTPMHVYQATNDELIPVADVRRLVRRWCRRGATVRYREDPTAEHLSLAATGATGALRWLADRFAGEPAPDTC